MIHSTLNDSDSDMLEGYDFNTGFQCKYVKKYHADRNLILLDEDIEQILTDVKSVYDALRALAKIISKYEKKVS